MLTEALIVGITVALVCGALCFYLYYCFTYLEKKVGMMESILVDVRMTLDSLLMEDRQEGAVPTTISSAMPPPMPAATTFTAPEPLESSEAEAIPEEKFYSSVLEQAHENAEEASPGSTVGSTDPAAQTLEEVLQSIQATESIPVSGGVSIGSVVGSSTPLKVGPNYDAMTRAELFSLLDQRGLRAKKSASRNEIIGVLRRAESNQNGGSSAGTETGAENVSEPTGSLFPAGDSMDSGFPVDLGQAGGGMGQAGSGVEGATN